jgi:hypothetical protein
VALLLARQLLVVGMLPRAINQLNLRLIRKRPPLGIAPPRRALAVLPSCPPELARVAVVAEPIPVVGRMRLLEQAAERVVLAMGMVLAREQVRA